MIIYFGGAEVPSHRKLLDDNHVTDVYMSFTGLKRRSNKPWLISENFPDYMNVMVDSGAYTFNKGVGVDLDEETVRDSATSYEEFIALNAGRICAFTEFDAIVLGLDWIEARRVDYYNAFGDKFVPVWHADAGLAELHRLSDVYGRVGILQTALGDRDLVPVLNSLAERGTQLHGLGMTKKDPMREVSWASVGSTSWLSPMKYGDTFVWTGFDLKRYTKPMKEKCRKQHRTLFENNGMDAARIAADDSTEVAKLSLWSWGHFRDYINQHSTTNSGVIDPLEITRLTEPRKRTEHGLLPGLTFDDTELQATADSSRRCDTCFLKKVCPKFEPGAECYYQLPIVVKTPDDIKTIENVLISIQTQRVAFARVAEDMEGGFPDPNVSNEIDRLSRLIKMQRDGTMSKFSMVVSASGDGKPNLVDTLFPQVAEAQNKQIEGKKVDDIMESAQIFEAEVLND
jgi:hypothetical protein